MKKLWISYDLYNQHHKLIVSSDFITIFHGGLQPTILKSALRLLDNGCKKGQYYEIVDIRTFPVDEGEELTTTEGTFVPNKETGNN